MEYVINSENIKSSRKSASIPTRQGNSFKTDISYKDILFSMRQNGQSSQNNAKNESQNYTPSNSVNIFNSLPSTSSIHFKNPSIVQNNEPISLDWMVPMAGVFQK